MESLSAMESHQKGDCLIHKFMDCNKAPQGVTSTKPRCKACKKEYKCGTACPVCFKLCLSFINIIKICTNRSTNVPNTWLIANKLGQLTCINGRRFQLCNPSVHLCDFRHVPLLCTQACFDNNVIFCCQQLTHTFY